MLIKIENAEAYLNESGMDWSVTCCDSVGRQYYRTDLKLELHVAIDLAKKVNERGIINADLWACHVPYGSDAWLLDGYEERQIEDERFGYC
jgi:hypothetical protein